MRLWPRRKEVAAVPCDDWRQGDVFSVKHHWTISPSGKPTRIECRLGVAVVSQSCDAAQPSRPEVHVAPVIELDESLAGEARIGKRIAFAGLPEIGENFFADLTQISTVPKAILQGVPRTRGVQTDAHVRRFAGTLARRFGRFAFPNEVITCMDPLKKALASKARKENSPYGKVLRSVYAIRMLASQPNGWERTPHDLTLIVILNPDALPSGEMPDEPKGLRASVSPGGKANETKIAEKILHSTTTDAERYWCWHYLADIWASGCMKIAINNSLTDVVRSVAAEVLPVDEFTFDRVNVSEDVDLDYLSEPLPSYRDLA